MYKNTFHCFCTIARTEGPLAFLTGLPSTVLRNAVWNGIFFSSVFAMRERIGPVEGAKGQAVGFFTGFSAGFLATCFNAPFDVAKSRIQGDAGNTRQYTSTFQTLALIFRTEGPTALYKGFEAKAWRMSLGAAVQFMTFEAVMGALQ